jgi:hypothetical protein
MRVGACGCVEKDGGSVVGGQIMAEAHQVSGFMMKGYGGTSTG